MNEFITLVYAQWRSTRAMFGMAMAVSITLSLIVWLDASNPAITLFVVQFFWLMLLMLAQGNDEMKFNMPWYLTRLPVDAWKLAAARMTYGLATNIALALWGTSLCYALYGSAFQSEWPFFEFAVGAALVYAILQAGMWWVGPAGIGWTLAVVFAVPYTLTWVLAIFDIETFEIGSLTVDAQGKAIFPVGALLVILLSYIVGVGAIAQHRKGRFSSLGELTLFRKSDATLESVRTEKFDTPEDALRWFEYRRTWEIFPWFLTIVYLFLSISIYKILGSAVPTLAETADGSIKRITPILSTEAMAFFASVGVPGAIAFAFSLIGGTLLFRFWGQADSKHGSFLFYQPATTMELTTARWKASARALVLGLLPFLGIMAFASFFNHVEVEGVAMTTFERLTMAQPAFVVVLSFVAAAVLTCLVGWSFTSPESLTAFIICWALAIPIASIYELQRLSLESPDQYPALITAGNVLAYAALGVMVIGLLWLLARTVLYLKKHALLRTKTLLILTLLSPIGIYLVSNIGYEWSTDAWRLPQFPILLTAILLPILATPACTHWYRHRR